MNFHFPKILYWTILYLIFNNFVIADSNEEARMLWISRWEYQNRYDIEKIMQNAAEYGFNTILFQVRGNGTVNYYSNLEPLMYPNFNGDPLQIALNAAHQHGLALHAWINVYPGWCGPNPPQNRNQLYHQHPDWFMRDKNQNMQKLENGYLWLSPTHPEVQQHLLNLCRELLEKYAIDGLHLDYIRYPGPGYSYDATSLQLFEHNFKTEPTNLPEKWVYFRRTAINRLVQKIQQLIQQQAPRVILSAAVVQEPHTSLHLYFQDTYRWLANHAVDFVLPMLYSRDDELFEKRLESHLLEAHQHDIFPGIMIYNAQQLSRQIALIRQKGLKGHSLFSYQLLFPNHRPNEMARMLRNQVYVAPAIPPNCPWKQPGVDYFGPYISKTMTNPKLVQVDRAFDIYCKIIDPAGVYDDLTGSEGYGVYLHWTATGNFKNAQEITMSRHKNSPNIFKTDVKIPPQAANPQFTYQIFARDNLNFPDIMPITASIASNEVELGFASNFVIKERQNPGYSQQQHVRIYPGFPLFHPPDDFGTALTGIRGIAIDPAGLIWVSCREPDCIRVFDLNGNEANFSPIKYGLNSNGQRISISSPTAITIDTDGQVYVLGNKIVFKYDSHTGRAQTGFALPFKANGLAIDQHHRLFVIRSWGNRWCILNTSGQIQPGSECIGGLAFQDVAVSPDGRTVYVVGGKFGVIYKWKKRADSNQYDLVDSQVKGWENIGGIHIDRNGVIYICQTYSGNIILLDPAEEILDILPRRITPLPAPRDAATDFYSNLLITYGLGAESPEQLLKWVKIQ
ncbi:family 10 glycosylhydrolase [candidate division KSB1 bacterium]|nr:family 10 glycosylhydrolase [candidate division KSB1 bacterium]